jgi:hypothetical protein
VEVVTETTFPPQQNPTAPHVLIDGENLSRDFKIEGIRETAAGGDAIVERNSPRFAAISGVGGGYLMMVSSRIGKRNAERMKRIRTRKYQDNCHPRNPE